MAKMLRFVSVFVLATLSTLAGTATLQGQEATMSSVPPAPVALASYDPLMHWEFDYESGIIWNIGGGATPLTYVVLPQILTLKTPTVIHRTLWGGDLVVRSRFSLLLEPIIKGPERYYFGTSASASFEWWNPQRTTSVFFASGGGLGVMHSKGHQIAGAQGQDLNFNWLMYLGGRYHWKPGMSATVGLYFQHISNKDLDKVNPGLNSLGPLFGLTWHF